MRRIGLSPLAGVMIAGSLLAAQPALADQSPAKAAAPINSPQSQSRAANHDGANVAAIAAMIDKMFPAQQEPDPKRLALARASARLMWADGAYARMMTSVVANLFTGAIQMKTSGLAEPTGKTVKGSANAATNDSDTGDKKPAKDPYFAQRMTAIREVIDGQVAKLSVVVDPRMREGLARAMAHRFDARQLTDINAFFATPSGRALAAQYTQLWFDPDALRSMMSAVPDMLKLMPETMQKIKAVDERFPKPAKPAQEPTKH